MMGHRMIQKMAVAKKVRHKLSLKACLMDSRNDQLMVLSMVYNGSTLGVGLFD